MDAGIVSYGAYVPRYRILPETIGRCRIETVSASDLIGWMRDGGVR